MFGASLFCFGVVVHRGEQVLYVVDEPFAVCKTNQSHCFSAVGALWLGLLDPGAEAVLAGQLGAGGAHAWFLDVLKADVALQEGEILALPGSLHYLL